MSLFEDSQFQYRDTFFVFFEKENRPSMDKIESSFAELGPKYEVRNIRSRDGDFESISIVVPHDHAGMDVAYEEGEDVQTQIHELAEEFQTITLVGDDSKKLSRIMKCNARFDIYHFEQVDSSGEEAVLDPGGLLLVMKKLSELTDGVGLDPQSQALM